jgi:hypothetical protein
MFSAATPPGIEPSPEPLIQHETSEFCEHHAPPNPAGLERKCVDTREPVTNGDDSIDAVEVALAAALERASVAGEWAVVATLARELEARRAAERAPVVSLEAERARRR